MQHTQNHPRRVSATNVVLATIGLAGLITMAVLAPNAIQSLAMFRRKNGRPYILPEQQMRTTLGRAIGQGLISVVKRESGTKAFSLTPKGERRLWQYRVKNINIEKPKRWDGKWRMIIFDIKEKRKSVREWLRTELRSIGFIKLQNSVWVYPYGCEEFITLLKADASIGKDVLYVVADHVENDASLRRIFKLAL